MGVSTSHNDRHNPHDWDWLEVRTGIRGRMVTALGLRMMARRLRGRALRREQAEDAAEQEGLITRLVVTDEAQGRPN